MTPIFLVALFVGLASGTVVMWRGVERYDRRAPKADRFGRELPPGRVGHLVPVGSAGLLGFGTAGYLLTAYSTLPNEGILAISFAVALFGGFAAFLLVARWVSPAAQQPLEDERFSLQGFPARVVRAIDEREFGEIAYEAGGRSVTVRARSSENSQIPAGTDVAIERLEDGIAYVELWSAVEKRL